MYTCFRCAASYELHSGFCIRCGGFDSLITIPSRPADNLWKSEGGRIASAEAIVRSSHAPSLTSSEYPTLEVGRTSLVGLYGPAGSGKSTLMTKFADGFPGAVLYLTLEEGLDSETLANRLRRLEVFRSDLHFGSVDTANDIGPMIEKVDAGLVCVDSLSVSTLCVDDLKRITVHFGIPVLFSLHCTKEGTMAGNYRDIHLSDVIVRVDDLKWELEKSRFTALIGGDV